MKRLFVLIAALGALLLFHGEALASHFRYGTINWTIPDPQNAPSAVKFTVSYGIVAGSPLNLQKIQLYFGDGTDNGPDAVGAVVGTGTDAGGQQYEVREFSVTHTYAGPGPYTAYFNDCCRIPLLINGANKDYRVDTKVVLQPGNLAGPIAASPPVIQMQTGGLRTYTFPTIDTDSNPITCRFGTDAETGFPTPVPVVPDPPGPGTGGQQPTLTKVMNGCQLSWNLIDAQLAQRYVVHVMFESTHNGQVSSTAIDLIVEMVSAPPPLCAGGGLFVRDVGVPLSTVLTGSHNLASNLTVSQINPPAGATLLPGGSGPSPFMNTFSWTPTLADRGTARIVEANFTNVMNHTGTCFLILQVPNCPMYGSACTVGVGECQKSGTNVCNGPGVTVCSVTPGTPSPEVCDGKDNNCNGASDEGDPGGGMTCSTGLLGVCSSGKTHCLSGASSCVPDVQPGALLETCDSADNNCDGAVDEGFNVGNPCSVGIGQCTNSGTIICDAAGGAKCSAVPGNPIAEVCGDNVDNDCNGVLENGCIDSDNDGLFDNIETSIGSNPLDADSDDDGVIDGDEPSYAEDTDGDGLINVLDPDSDNDGLYDGTELGNNCSNPATNIASGHCIADADPATTTDPLDWDSDNGTVSDGAEDANHNGKKDPGETDPTAGHPGDDLTSPNTDSDDDGLSDNEEEILGSNPNDADSDDDGVIDGQEPNLADDTDGDGLINVLDPDSDNDGLFDGTEIGLGCSDPATNVNAGHCIPDADGATHTGSLDPDSDDGGVIDGSEDINGNGKVDPGETDPNPGHGADDVTVVDTDGDGLSDDLEEAIGTDPLDADSDDDGLPDGQEPNYNEDSDGDGEINALDPDSDNDGLFDGTESGKGCSNADTDPAAMTCIADADPTTHTSPLDPDSDNGGAPDGAEDENHNGKLDPEERDPTAGHGSDDFTNDSDHDGLPDDTETMIGTDPDDADSDDDGVPDGWELFPGEDSDGDGLINALDPDSDNDGLFDGTEMGLGCDNMDTDASQNVCTPDGDGGATKTDPLDPDTDGGGVIDGGEDLDLDGVIDAGEINPTTGHGDDDQGIIDSDNDGLPDALEETIGTDPLDSDSDDDGVPDGQEPNYNEDSDGDGTINALDPDSDDDGLFDGTEMGLGCNNGGTDKGEMHCIPDADPGTTTSPLDPDTDGGGALDGEEDENHDGKLDPEERDPTEGHAADDSTMPMECDEDSDCGGPMSGVVCDPATNECEPGCHTPGNGCADGKECTSDDEMIGECVDPSTGCDEDSDCGGPQSHTVCDPDTSMCVEGCHEDGNGCDPSMVCKSDGADAIGECVECTSDAQCGDAQSGKVCDSATNTCGDGCHEGGNGCPDGKECSATAAGQVGQCVDVAEPEGVVVEGSGILCAAQPANENGSAGWLVPLALGGLLAARRRRRQAEPGVRRSR